MKIICLVKFVPSTDSMAYDYKKNTLIRQQVKTIINPEDACALALALKIKSQHKNTKIKVISMGPATVLPLMEDLLRRGIDEAVLLSDQVYSGSDTYATSIIISKYLNQENFTYIFCGSQTLDGGTAHVPAQIAAVLAIDVLTGIIMIDEKSLTKKSVNVNIETEDELITLEVQAPAILGLNRQSPYKLPFVSYANLDMDVSTKLQVLSNKELGFNEDSVGAKGSKTKVVGTYLKKLPKKNKTFVETNTEGIKTVYKFIKARGFI